MISLDAIVSRWSAAFSGDALIPGISGTSIASLDTFLRIEEKVKALTVTMITSEVRSMLTEIVARRNLHDQALEDIHALVRVVVELPAYGKVRIALSEAHEAWVRAGKPEGAQARTFAAWMEARQQHRRAIDRIEAIAVQLAGGDVGKVCRGEVSNGQP